MRRAFDRRGVLVGFVLVLASVGLGPAANAQFGVEGATTERDRRRLANRMVSFLELPERRREAVTKLLAMDAAMTVPALVRVLDDPRSEVVCRAVHLLRRLGPDARAALPALAKLKRSSDPQRAHAGGWGLLGILHERSSMLVDNGTHRVLTVDPAGVMRVWLEKKGIYDAERLANGNYLVAYVKGELHEVNPKGETVWSRKGFGAVIDVDRLPNGNTLVSTGRGKKVVEIDPTGKTVWEFGSKWPNDADRLPSGNTLVSDYQARKVVEVDPSGKVVWSVQTPAGAIDAERLNNGNTLIVLNDTKMVVEMDPSGDVVREFKQVKTPKCAKRLANGHTLIGGEGKAVEVDTNGKVVWSSGAWGTLSTFHRF